MNENVYSTVVIVAAGVGKRMGTKTRKQFLKLAGKDILAYSIEKFQICKKINDIILVTGEENIDYCKNEIVGKYGFTKVRAVIAGGKERRDSVLNGIKEAYKKTDVILIHDGVRPFIDVLDIEKCVDEAAISGACVLGVRAKDTIKICGKDNIIIDTPDRNDLWHIQTPQAFKYDIICNAYYKAENDGFMGTDDAVLVERTGFKVKVIEGSYENIKITTADDMVMAKAFIDHYNKQVYR